MRAAPLSRGALATGLAALLILGASCTSDGRDTAVTSAPVAPASATAPRTSPTTTIEATTTTGAATLAAVTTTTSPTPPGKNPACLQRAHFGDPADSDYILPYPAGEAYYVIRSYCATGPPGGGHSDQLAYDWFMPIGAEVVAARGGWVVEMRESNPDNGRGRVAENYVYIEHPDGTVAFYAHLMQHGVGVEVSQWVAQGERIGSSGNSGSTGGTPHLHFGVYTGMPRYEEMGVAVSFSNADGPLDILGGLLVNRLYIALPGGV